MRNIGLLLGNRAAPARAAATVTILFGLASTIGWVLGMQALTSVIPGSAEMKVNTAVAIVLCGASLLILSHRTSMRLQLIGQIASIAVLLLGSATLAEYFVGRSFGIDELLIADRAGSFNADRGRMSPFSALAFISIGSALLALPHRKLHFIAQIGAVGAMLIGGVSLLGYLWGATEIVTDRWIPPVALNTAGCFALLGGGIILTPKKNESSDLDKQIAALAAVEIKILTGFIIALSLLLIGGSFTYRTSVNFADSVEWVAHTQEVRRSLQSTYGSLAGSEVALRDYLLTKSADNLKEYEVSKLDAQTELVRIRRLTEDNPVQRSNVLVLESIVSGRMSAMASTLTAFQGFGLSGARAVIFATRNASPTRAVRAQMNRMDAEEAQLLAERNESTKHVRATTLVSLVATLAVASCLFIALFKGIHSEMLARREAEQALRASDQYTRSILDSSPDCLGVLSLDGRLTQMTAAGMRLMDIEDFSTVENADWVKIWKGADRAAARVAMDTARRGSDGRFQGSCPTLKGTPKWWDVIVMPIMGSNGKPERLLAVSRDISDVKRNENELRETNRFLDSLFEALPLMVYVKDARTLRYIRLNRECERISGFTRESMIGRTARDVLPPAEADMIEITDLEALTTGRLVEIDEEAVSTADHGAISRHTMKLPILDDNGAAQYLLGISADVTRQKLTERAINELNFALEAKAAQLEITNKELESFSYSVSHDLRAPLRAVDGFALMIEEDHSAKLDAEGRRYLAVIRANSKRMGALIDDLLEFSRLGRLPVAAHDINVDLLVREVVTEALHEHDLRRQDEATPRIEIGSLPPARGDRNLLRQVWTNLIANAIKYSSKQPHPTIQVSGERNATENLYSVRDNGVGFNMAYVGKLFGVFSRLHRAEEFSGTGVGLAIVHRVVSRHGGRVWAEGKLNDGAVFSFALPRGGNDG